MVIKLNNWKTKRGRFLLPTSRYLTSLFKILLSIYLYQSKFNAQKPFLTFFTTQKLFFFVFFSRFFLFPALCMNKEKHGGNGMKTKSINFHSLFHQLRNKRDKRCAIAIGLYFELNWLVFYSDAAVDMLFPAFSPKKINQLFPHIFDF